MIDTDYGTAQAPHLRWHDRIPLWALIGVPIALALALLIGILASTRQTPEPTAVPAAPAPPIPDRPGAPPLNTSQRANACLGGGEDLDNAVLYAQKNAPLTETGAAEFAATVWRWLGAIPYPPRREQVGRAVMEPFGPAIDTWLRNEEPPEVVGWHAGLGFDEGYYLVESFDAGHAATVSLLGENRGSKPDGTPVVEDPWAEIDLRVQNGHWRMVGMSNAGPSHSVLTTEGIRFQGEC